jgi:mono/diheme cytochrome c family protein
MLLVPSIGRSQDPAAFYKKNCAACHSIGGGRLLGPDLRGVGDRKDRRWLEDFIVNPKATLDAGDPYGRQLAADAKGMCAFRG